MRTRIRRNWFPIPGRLPLEQLRLPIVTLVVVLPAIIAALWPAASSVLVYDRNLILDGEVWRIFAGNWVHFSMTHFVCDVLVFLMAGALIELRGYRGLAALCLLSPVVIGLAVFLLRPNLELFGGLSGIATGAMVLLSLQGLREGGIWGLICLMTLVAVTAKTCFEFATGQLAFVQSGSILLKPEPMAHIAGALCGAPIWLTIQSDQTSRGCYRT